MESQKHLTHAPVGGVQAMFDRVAPRYDLLNRLLSAGVDQWWRTQAIAALNLKPGQRLLDLCTGTCDLALSAMKYSPRSVVGLDVAREMLIRGRKKAAAHPMMLVQADAAYLPVATGSFDRACVGFGIRNVGQLDSALGEVVRILKKDGRFVILEFTTPTNALVRRMYHAYFRHVLPRVGGWISGDAEAYRYLPESVGHFPAPPELRQKLLAAGFSKVRYRLLTGGIACLHVADR